MYKSLTDKWVRKAVYNLLNDIVVDGKTIKCFDSRVNQGNPKHFILMTTQTSSPNKHSKQDWDWESSILIDITTSYTKNSNAGGRILVDNILDRVRDLTKDIQLDAASGLRVIDVNQEFPNDIVTTTDTQNIFRKLMRLELKIN